jgi:hypothetical protein
LNDGFLFWENLDLLVYITFERYIYTRTTGIIDVGRLSTLCFYSRFILKEFKHILNVKVMKTILLSITFFLIVAQSHAQLLEKADGKYYDHKGVVYSGTYIEYFPSGSVQIEMNVLNGEKQGNTTLYFENGQKRELRSFKANKMDGTWITWNESGVRIAEATYRDGIKHGKWGIWDENGTHRYEMFYTNGEKSGLWTIWDQDGNVQDQKQF